MGKVVINDIEYDADKIMLLIDHMSQLASTLSQLMIIEYADPLEEESLGLEYEKTRNELKTLLGVSKGYEEV